MLDDYHGIAEIAQVEQRFEQAAIVALMQADGRFVENVHHPDQSGADLAGQTDALCFAAGECLGAAIQRQVAESDIGEKAQPVTNFLDHLAGNFAAPSFELHRQEERQRIID